YVLPPPPPSPLFPYTTLFRSVGVRGSRIKNIVEELGGVERIDIVRWNDSLQVLIQNALQPATIEEVFLYEKLQRAIVLVKEDQLDRKSTRLNSSHSQISYAVF